MIQLITPTPHIPCRPGWCLQYVRQAFGLPAKYGTATEAWEKSTSKHRDRSFPQGVWLPIWYGLDNEPAGHVVLMAPDGSCYSTSDLGSTPHHHPDLGDLERYYAYYGMTLTYRGWTEDVASYPVIEPSGLAAMGGTITPTNSQQGFLMALTDEQQAILYNAVLNLEGFVWKGGPSTQKGDGDPTSLFGRTITTQAQTRDVQLALTTALPALLTKPGNDPAGVARAVAAAIPQELAQQVVDALAARLK